MFAGEAVAALAAFLLWPRQPDLAGDMYDAWRVIQRGEGKTAPIYLGERRLDEAQRKIAIRVLHTIAGEFELGAITRAHRFPTFQGVLIRYTAGGREREMGFPVPQYGNDAALNFEPMLNVAIRLRWMKEEGLTSETREEHFVRTMERFLPDLNQLSVSRIKVDFTSFPSWASYVDGLKRGLVIEKQYRSNAVDESPHFRNPVVNPGRRPGP